MKSLQDKYNLITEGKGNKELFLKEAKSLFPSIVTNVLTYDQAVHNLAERGLISVDLQPINKIESQVTDWFKIFNENVETTKATIKEPSKEVVEKETAGYDYKDTTNKNNHSTQQLLAGYYVELRDPKNAEKSEEELINLVIKNLQKDQAYYIKDSQFGLKGTGYVEEIPGLGKTKEVTGKYKSSGMEPIKLNESKHGDKFDLNMAKSDLRMLNKANVKGEKYEKMKAALEKKIADLEAKMGSEDTMDEIRVKHDKDIPTGRKPKLRKKNLKESGYKTMEFTFDEIEHQGEHYNITAIVETEETLEPSSTKHPDDPYTATESNFEWSIERITNVEKYDEESGQYEPAKLSTIKLNELKNLIEKQYYTKYYDTIYDLAGEEPDEREYRDLDEVEDNRPFSKKSISTNMLTTTNFLGGDRSNILSKDEKDLVYIIVDMLMRDKNWVEKTFPGGPKETEILRYLFQYLRENYSDKPKEGLRMIEDEGILTFLHELKSYISSYRRLSEAIKKKKSMNKEKVKNTEPIKISESRFYGHSLETVKQEAYEESLNGYVQHENDNGDGTFTVSDWYDDEKTVVSYEDGRKFNDTTNRLKRNNMKETLSEAKKRAIEKHIKEIEKLSEVAAIDYKIEKLDEKITELQQRISVTEGDDIKDMVDKRALGELKRDIKYLESKKKMYEARKHKLEKGHKTGKKSHERKQVMNDGDYKHSLTNNVLQSIKKGM